MLFFSLALASLGPLALAYGSGSSSGSYGSAPTALPVAKYQQTSIPYAPSGPAYGSGNGRYGNNGYDDASVQGIQVAVRSSHNTEYYNVDSTPSYATPTNLFLTSQSAPVNMMFQTLPGPINVNHVYAKSPGSFRVTESTEEPHRFVHTVRRPVVQEVREIIAPVRFVRQEIRPVEENIQTIVARNAGFGGNGGGDGEGASGAGGFGGGLAGGLGGGLGGVGAVTGAGNGALLIPAGGSGFGGGFRSRGRFGKGSRKFLPSIANNVELVNNGPVGEAVLKTSAEAVPVQFVEEVINVGVIGPRGCGGATNPGCKSIPYYAS